MKRQQRGLAATRARQPKTLTEYIVPMRFTISGEVYVDAEDADQARRLAEQGRWTRREITAAGDLSDWDVTGEPKENT